MDSFPIQGFTDDIGDKAGLCTQPQPHMGEFLNFFQADERLIFQQGQIYMGKAADALGICGIVGIQRVIAGNGQKNVFLVDGLIFQQVVLRIEGKRAKSRSPARSLLSRLTEISSRMSTLYSGYCSRNLGSILGR